MLPERLSNELCSLQPNQDRLCFSAVVEMNERPKCWVSGLGEPLFTPIDGLAMKKPSLSLKLAKEI